jgi:hypothetical protein
VKPAERRAVEVFVAIIVVAAALSLFSCLRSGWDEEEEPTGYGWSSIREGRGASQVVDLR